MVHLEKNDTLIDSYRRKGRNWQICCILVILVSISYAFVYSDKYDRSEGIQVGVSFLLNFSLIGFILAVRKKILAKRASLLIQIMMRESVVDVQGVAKIAGLTPHQVRATLQKMKTLGMLNNVTVNEDDILVVGGKPLAFLKSKKKGESPSQVNTNELRCPSCGATRESENTYLMECAYCGNVY